jgi:L-fuconolactonase
MIRIDAHNHFWKFDPVRDSWIDESMTILRKDFLPNDLEPILVENNFHGTIAVQADQSEEETNFLLGLADNHDFIKGVVGWVDFKALDIEEKLSSYSLKEKLCGFRHIAQAETDDRFLVSKDFLTGLRYLNSFDFTYDVLIYPRQLEAAIELANELPDQKLVLDHIAKPLIKAGIMEPWASQMRDLGSSKNVYCKISGIITEADHRDWNAEEIKPYLDVVFDAFDTDRIMFGSDWPVCLLAGTYAQVVQLIEDYIGKFEPNAMARIFGGNAIEFYKLKLDDS